MSQVSFFEGSKPLKITKPLRLIDGKEYMSVRAASRAEGRAQATVKKHGGVMQ